MIRVSDYVARHLADVGIRHVFMLTGGGAMHLNDSFGRERRIQYVCCHHEQACAIAAEGYVRASGRIAVVNVTSGPGGTNAITGVLGQWLDSIPGLYISGQVRYAMTVASTGLPLRQLGDQEADIVALVKPITKYAVMVTDPNTIRYHLDRALFLAQHGRPGPVWLDIPLDVQAAAVEPDRLPAYNPAEDRIEFAPDEVDRQAEEVLNRLQAAQRPVILAGAGIRLADAIAPFRRVIEKLNIPVLVAWEAIDLLETNHPLYCGRPGTLGQRGANFVFQNADVLLSVGCRLNTRQIGYLTPSLARAAFKIVLDIDPVELQKPTIRPDLPIHCDAGLFLETLDRLTGQVSIGPKSEWLSWCKARNERYPVVLPEYRDSPDGVNPYVFCDVLSDSLEPDDLIVSANGSACVIPIQALRIKRGQRHIVNSGCAAMGFGLPAAVGACFAREKRRVICLEGDGSIQLNIQELQTIVHHDLPVKILIFNNQGYVSVRQTQTNFFNRHFVGEGRGSGVTLPDMARIADAYGIGTVRISNHAELRGGLRTVLDARGPALCDVQMPADQTFIPRMMSRRLDDGRMVSPPLEDMYPFLDRAELASNMLIPVWEEPTQ